MSRHTIDVVTRMQDNGDGGYTMYVYNNEEEMLEDHPRLDEISRKHMSVDAYNNLRECILNGEDEYELGYIGSDTIEIEVVDGVAKLAKSFSLHAGQ